MQLFLSLKPLTSLFDYCDIFVAAAAIYYYYDMAMMRIYYIILIILYYTHKSISALK